MLCNKCKALRLPLERIHSGDASFWNVRRSAVAAAFRPIRGAFAFITIFIIAPKIIILHYSRNTIKYLIIRGIFALSSCY